jgi:hypothetical protein
VTLVNAGKFEESLPIFKRVFEQEPVWAELVPRLVESGLLTADADQAARITAQPGARANPSNSP